MTIASPTLKRLVVDELHTTLQQDVVFDRRTVVERVMPHLYASGSPIGTITLRIKKGVAVLAESTLDLTDAMTRAGKTKANYHGWVSFQFPTPPILKPDTYTVELAAGTYSFGSAWIGWVKLPSEADHLNPATYPFNLRLVEIRAP
jgi:hypothetical protein